MCVCTYIGELPGILSGEALGEAFANMDAFVFPSRTDTFGLVVMEAMASGVPVVVSPETGERVGIRHGVTGFQRLTGAESKDAAARARNVYNQLTATWGRNDIQGYSSRADIRKLLNAGDSISKG
jgi:glycosyltransferase involved in cell wall biosynthesis